MLETTEVGFADHLALLVNDLPSDDRGLDATGEGQSLVGRETGAAMQFRRREHPFWARIEEDDVGVEARCQVAPARPERGTLGGLRAGQPNHVRKGEPT